MSWISEITGQDAQGEAAAEAISSQGAATNRANDTLTDYRGYANDALQGGYQDQQQAYQPYQSVGMRALSGLSDPNFGQNIGENLQMDPGYQFRLQQGSQALERSAAARGGLNSGRTMKALTRYGQDFASNEYNNSYNREYGRMSNLAGLGFNASSGMANAAGNYGAGVSSNQMATGAGISNNQMGFGNAQAAAQMAAGGRQANTFGQLMQFGGQVAGGFAGGGFGK